VEDWYWAEARRQDEQRCSGIVAELELYGAILDGALHEIFLTKGSAQWWDAEKAAYHHEYVRWNLERRAAEVQWLFESAGYWRVGKNGDHSAHWVPGAREICSALEAAGWCKTCAGWPTAHQKLCEVVTKGLAKGLTIWPRQLKGKSQLVT